MSSTKVRQYLRAHVLGLVAIFIALSGTALAGSDGPTASSSVVTDAKFKKLKRKVAGLRATISTPARGDLTGVYPDLNIAPNAVTTVKLADNAVRTAKIEDNAVNDAKIAPDSIGNSELKTVSLVQNGAVVNVPAGMENVQTVSCAAGSQVLGGGALWDSVDPDLRMINSFSANGSSWTVNVSNQDGVDHGVRAFATCLSP